MNKYLCVLLSCVVFLAVGCSTVEGARLSLNGTVVDGDSVPVPGAMVTAKRVGGIVATTVFADAEGHYEMDGLRAGQYTVNGRRGRYQSASATVDIGRSSAIHKLVLKEQEHMPVSGAEAITSIPDSLEKRRLVQNCVMCHGIGASDTPFAGENDPAFWEDAIQRMETAQGAFLSPDFDHKKQAVLLAKYIPVGTDGVPLPETDVLTNVVIREYDLPLPDTYPHDVGIDRNGRVWVADYENNFLEVLNPETEEWKLYPYPIEDAGSHSVIEGEDGKIWIVLNKGNHIVSFDPATEKFDLYPVPDPDKTPIGPRPHTHVFDSKGSLWYTEIAGNRVSRLDPKTGEITVFDLPAQPDLFEDPFWLWPYGITIDSRNNVYYTKLGGNRIGRIDAETHEIKEFEMPVPYSGPRRLAVDAEDKLWIPAFTTGKLYRLDPDTERFKEYDIPTPNSSPYALFVDKKKGQVWICESAANKIGIFDIASETFSEILLPSRYGYTRKIDQDPNTGVIWTSYSQKPTGNNKVVSIQFTD